MWWWGRLGTGREGQIKHKLFKCCFPIQFFGTYSILWLLKHYLKDMKRNFLLQKGAQVELIGAHLGYISKQYYTSKTYWCKQCSIVNQKWNIWTNESIYFGIPCYSLWPVWRTIVWSWYTTKYLKCFALISWNKWHFYYSTTDAFVNNKDYIDDTDSTNEIWLVRSRYFIEENEVSTFWACTLCSRNYFLSVWPFWWKDVVIPTIAVLWTR